MDGNQTFEQIGNERLRDQAIFTANALRNMARTLIYSRVTEAEQLHGHADDLEKAAGVKP